MTLNTDEKLTRYEWLNDLLQRYGACKVPYNIYGHREQWLIGAYYDPHFSVLHLSFCQGRNIGRIKKDGGYYAQIDMPSITTQEEFWQAFKNLDPVCYREWRNVQPWYIKQKAEEKALNIKIGRAKAELTKAVKYGNKRKQKHIDTLKKHDKYDEWEESVLSLMPEQILRTKKLLETVL